MDSRLFAKKPKFTDPEMQMKYLHVKCKNGEFDDLEFDELKKILNYYKRTIKALGILKSVDSHTYVCAYVDVFALWQKTNKAYLLREMVESRKPREVA